MQTNRSRYDRPVQGPRVPVGKGRFAADMNSRPALILLGVLCALVPPLGVVMLWRASRITLPVRCGLTLLGFFSMTLILFLLMRPENGSLDILPMPAVPEYAGYGYIPSDQPAPTEIPAPPPAEQPVVPPENSTQSVDPSTLTDDSIVFAVTNNASSYHLSPVCDFQENNRQLTLLEALYEGLEPCEKCVGAAG